MDMVSRPKHGDGVGHSNILDLPDDIVVNILQGLTELDAFTTSLVSRRFLKLWTTFFPRLDFEDCLDNVANDENRILEFMEFVNHSLDAHKGNSIGSLRIAFDAMIILAAQHQDVVRRNLQRWVEFSINKCAQSLELDLNHTAWTSGGAGFGFPRLDASNSSNLGKLTSLSLNFVDVSDEQVVDLLETYLINLETLVIENSLSLRTVRVNAQKLKHLEIRDNVKCISSIDIVSAPNLVCVKNVNYYTRGSDITGVRFLGNEILPELSSVSLRGILCRNVISELQEYAPFLEKLVLGMDRICRKQLHSRCSDVRFPEFGNVKELVLYFTITRKTACIMDLMFIVDACPKLQRLEFKYGLLRDSDCEAFSGNQWDQTSYINNYQCLKVVVFDGWWGLEPEVEFASYLIDNAVNLENVTFDLTRYRNGKKKTKDDLVAAYKVAQKVSKGKSGLVYHDIVLPEYS